MTAVELGRKAGWEMMGHRGTRVASGYVSRTNQSSIRIKYGIAMVKRKSKSCSEIKKKKQRNAYEHAQSLSCDEEFWDKEQQEMYLQIYKKAEVFAHRSVHLSDNIDTKYEKLGLKGNRGACGDILLRLTRAIYTEAPFDIANFLLSEMCIIIEDPNHKLPYGPYIFSLLRHLKIINDESIGETCSLRAYNPLAMKKSKKSVIVQLEKKVESLLATFIKRMDELERKVEEFDKRIKDVETLLKGSSDIVFRRRGGN
ncbi:unnamed protein product [Triticum aestivum]|uniref:Uncharacterized protein n=2 Tax=Triticum TaxID=4564 RepID=A0A9R1S9L3_TRITD|nr:unnamed protein product [Triticum aestivum]VAH85551.1 unnamed protein product [Triticum turgidum subsp. durum]